MYFIIFIYFNYPLIILYIIFFKDFNKYISLSYISYSNIYLILYYIYLNILRSY